MPVVVSTSTAFVKGGSLRSMLDLPKLLSFLAGHQYMLAAALAIGFIARMTKDDARFLPDLSGRWRPLLVALLGLVAAGCDSVVGGTPWQSALANGLGAAVTALLGHTFLIETARGGKELPLGPLAKPKG